MDYNTIIKGDSLTVLKTIPDESVNCVITSPPYWGLRDYGIEPVIWDSVEGCEHEWGDNLPSKRNRWGNIDTLSEKQASNRGSKQMVKALEAPSGNFCLRCNAWRGSLGLEPTFELYIKHLCDIFDEVKRVLRKDGTCWVNLGTTMQNKCDTMIPERFAIEMINRGWIKRRTKIWQKPNCMPSSVKDDMTNDFEYIYFFVKSKKYWFEQVFEEVKPESVNRYNYSLENCYTPGSVYPNEKREKPQKWGFNPQGRNKRAVWTIPIDDELLRLENIAESLKAYKEEHTDIDISWLEDEVAKLFINYTDKGAVWKISTKPFPEAHFATFPEGLIEPMIQAGCPRYVCPKCGKAREKIYKTNLKNNIYKPRINEKYSAGSEFMSNKTRLRCETEIINKGYTSCSCNAGFEGGIVLDPFIGAGTTAIVAKKQGKRYLGIEIKQEYIDMANKRINKIPETLF